MVVVEMYRTHVVFREKDTQSRGVRKVLSGYFAYCVSRTSVLEGKANRRHQLRYFMRHAHVQTEETSGGRPLDPVLQ